MQRTQIVIKLFNPMNVLFSEKQQIKKRNFNLNCKNKHNLPFFFINTLSAP